MLISSKDWTALVITLLLTVVVMTMGIYTLSKIKPLSENIRGLEQSMQARYHAKSGEEIAKLIYYSDLEKSKAALNDTGFESKGDDEKAKAFCRTDGEVLINNSHQRKAVAKCIEFKTNHHCHPGGGPCHPGHSINSAISTCNNPSYGSGNYTDFLPAGSNATNESITYNCSQQDVADAQPIKDATWGVDTRITSQTTRIPQDCQGDSDLGYTTDGNCQNWNKLAPGDPIRINLSNMSDLALENASSAGQQQYSFAVRFRLPDLIKHEGNGNNPAEVLYTPIAQKDDAMILWNLYDQEIAFFPAEADNAITRFDLFLENKDNNGLIEGDSGGTSGVSLGNESYQGIWEDTVECENARNNTTLTWEEVQEACSKTLLEFFTQELGNCANRLCYLELQLVGDLSLAKDDTNFQELHPEDIKAPYLEYQILAGRSGGTSWGDSLKILDTKPVITSTGESNGYSVKIESVIEEDLLIPTASSPIGR